MVLRINNTPVNEKSQEIVQGYEEEFPYTVLAADLNQYVDRRTARQWHEQFEFGFVRRGIVHVQTANHAYDIHSGEGYFVNANMLHRNNAWSEGTVEIEAQLIDRKLLSASRLIEKGFVSPVEQCLQLEGTAITAETEQGAHLLGEMEAAFHQAEHNAPGHEMMMCAHVYAMWHDLYEMLEPQIRELPSTPNKDTVRIREMLVYIHGHFSEPLSVRQIGSSAGVCEREVYRCFAKVLNLSPVVYVRQYRVRQAAQMLLNGELTVSQISDQCGFSNTSYFDIVFRQEMGCTPLEYRKTR